MLSARDLRIAATQLEALSARLRATAEMVERDPDNPDTSRTMAELLTANPMLEDVVARA